jgi:copper transport protein
VVSEDSHVLSGSFVFHVQVETGATELGGGGGRRGLDVVAWAGRWLILAGATALAGVAVLRVAVQPPRGLGSGRARRYVVVAAAGLVAGAAIRLVAQVAAASDRSLFGALGLVVEATSGTRAGRLDGFRLLAAVVALGGALAWRRSRAAVFVVLAGAAGVMVVNAVGGHAFTSDRPSLTVLSDVVHQYGVAVWVGGLAAIAVLTRTTESEGRALLRIFSRLAALSLIIVVATGLVSAWLQVESLDALRSTTYGRVLVAKVGVFVVMAGLGWWNRGRLREVGERLAELMATVRAEAVLAAAALGLTASLVALVPAREQVSEPFTASRSDGSGMVTMTVSPARPGSNVLHLSFFDEAGRPRAVDAAEARVQLGDVPPRKIDLLPVLPDHYAATGFSLPRAGRWRVTITSLVRGVPSETMFEVPVR